MPKCKYCGGEFETVAIGGSNAGVHDWLACCRRKADAATDLLAALKGVVRVADRKTVEFDAARAAIARAEDSVHGEYDRLLSIEARARLVVAEWPRAGRLYEPMAEQLDALRDLLNEQSQI